MKEKTQIDSIQIGIAGIDGSLAAFLRTRFIATLARLFGSVTAPKETDTFTKTGYNKWTYAVGANKVLDTHAHSKSHELVMARWQMFTRNPVTINKRLDPHRPSLVENNRGYFRKIVGYIRWFCLEEIPFRRRDEHDTDSQNRGKLQGTDGSRI